MVRSRTGEPPQASVGLGPVVAPAVPRSEPRPIAWIDRHCIALGAASILGIVGSIAAFFVLFAQQWTYDDSGGAAGWEAPESAYWMILVVGAGSLLAAVLGAIGAVVALVRRRARRNRRGIAGPIGALLLCAPGVAVVLIAAGALLVHLAGR